ncbi:MULTISPECIES: signal peptidase II [Methylorubrum]|uniref:Lipoprotein signal peptidase n=2 Tax=Methylorubrum extorquens TaxID=408 RepID=C5AQL4_METEA|nr:MULTISPECIES: signal peptidase II [Methylorubrum]ACS40111.1 Lipoprotein signal peptidase (Prolipoprotein signal peptidase) (Signal peptidase II) (SPase II) [Methylorubrum extorquens AM1]EHP93188.1 Lipoprotein signal peptidase [Methylorubrum extorquens DSM 13060]MCP1541741.1 signal peptidase II [Methylorubrum extorquens]MCP1585722.1 signal peptidase II [Methylorubrum extorquens]BDL39718.1 lipoprotein signal peptidase [Methylorubrum sp. GM97]
MTAFRSGLIALLATLVLDQASKLWLYFGTDLVMTQPWRLAPFADFVVVWNRGVSYGLFQQEGGLGRWLLVAVSLAAAIGLSVWMRRAGSRLLAVALGLIVGGALGNAIDRAAYGAVFDFVHLHAGTWSWYVFNVADAAIVAGVVGLILDSLRPAPRSPSTDVAGNGGRPQA